MIKKTSYPIYIEKNNVAVKVKGNNLSSTYRKEISMYNQVLKEVDEYDVETLYEYDNYGNLLKSYKKKDGLTLLF